MAVSVTFLAEEAGIRQFLDVGTGMPSAEHTHQAAQEAAPDARVAYVDNDPLVLAHARAILARAREGATEYIEADLREPTGRHGRGSPRGGRVRSGGPQAVGRLIKPGKVVHPEGEI